MITESEFIPAWWLRGAHAQTVWPTLMRADIELTLRPERLELWDGDFVDLAWSDQGLSSKSPLVILLHGLGGNIQSAYVKGLLNACNLRGWRAVLMHFRGCSGEPNRLARSYHSGDTDDLDFLLRTLEQREPDTVKAAVGISLGGNVLLKWLGEHPDQSYIQASISVSAPLELRMAANHMVRGVSRLYQYWMLKQLHQHVRDKVKRSRLPIQLSQLDQWNCFWSFDDNVTAPLNGFSHVHDYYIHSSSRYYLNSITTPTLILHAEDDPFMPTTVLPSASELSPVVSLELSKQGGHVGFISGNMPGRAEYWLDQRVPAFFQDYL